LPGALEPSVATVAIVLIGLSFHGVVDMFQRGAGAGAPHWPNPTSMFRAHVESRHPYVTALTSKLLKATIMLIPGGGSVVAITQERSSPAEEAALDITVLLGKESFELIQTPPPGDDPAAERRRRAEALAALANGRREPLEQLRYGFIRRLHRASDDFAASEGLRVVEAALSLVPRPGEVWAGEGRQQQPPRRRWWRRKRTSTSDSSLVDGENRGRARN
jgi:hypothetical protein